MPPPAASPPPTLTSWVDGTIGGGRGKEAHRDRLRERGRALVRLPAPVGEAVHEEGSAAAQRSGGDGAPGPHVPRGADPALRPGGVGSGGAQPPRARGAPLRARVDRRGVRRALAQVAHARVEAQRGALRAKAPGGDRPRAHEDHGGDAPSHPGVGARPPRRAVSPGRHARAEHRAHPLRVLERHVRLRGVRRGARGDAVRAPQGRAPQGGRKGPWRAAGLALHARGGRDPHQRRACPGGAPRALGHSLPRRSACRGGLRAPVARLRSDAQAARTHRERPLLELPRPQGEGHQDRGGARGPGAPDARGDPRRMEARRVEALRGARPDGRRPHRADARAHRARREEHPARPARRLRAGRGAGAPPPRDAPHFHQLVHRRRRADGRDREDHPHAAAAEGLRRLPLGGMVDAVR